MMGNHEYCDRCGADDFHVGMPCSAPKLASKKSEEAEIAQRKEIGIQRLIELRKSINLQYPDLFKYDQPDAVEMRIGWWNLA